MALGGMLNIIFLLHTITYSFGYENKGRLHGQHRVYPDDAPSGHWYCVKKGDRLCSSDLSGYFVCYGDGYEEESFEACPLGTRCGCHIDTVCKLPSTCIPIDTPYPMEERATFTFEGHTFFNYSFRDPKETETKYLSGVVKQDVSEGKFLQVISYEEWPYNTFELIIPNGKGSFIKYSGNSDGPCSHYTTLRFEPFGDDIKNHHLIASNTTEDGRLQQTWQYRLSYEFMDLIEWKWKWVIMSDPLAGTSIPIRTEYYSDGEEDYDEIPYREVQVAHWKTTGLYAPLSKGVKWYAKYIQKEDWFSVPHICQ